MGMGVGAGMDGSSNAGVGGGMAKPRTVQRPARVKVGERGVGTVWAWLAMAWGLVSVVGGE